jgi:hypothetical protein
MERSLADASAPDFRAGMLCSHLFRRIQSVFGKSKSATFNIDGDNFSIMRRL